MKRTILITIIAALIVLCTANFAFADAPKAKYETFYQRGLEMYEYVLQPVPVALGYPKLSDAEIDELIASNDYRLIRDKISTVADCINYFTRAGFSEDVGSAYEQSWYKDTSGAQTLMRGGGSCQGMCNCLAYLLQGDYDNLYYAFVDAHGMVIIEQDEMFYMVNPVELQNPKMEKKRWWCDVWADRTICFADSIQELADSHYNSGTTSKFFLLDASGDFLPVTLAEIDGETVPCFPKGAEEYVTIYYGEAYHYLDPDYTSGNSYAFDCPDWRTGEYFVPDELVYDANNPNKRQLDYTLVDSNGQKKNPEHEEIRITTGQKCTYSVQFFDKKVKDYTVTVSDESRASVEKLEDGRFVLTAKTGESFYLRTEYKGVSALYKCWCDGSTDAGSDTDKTFILVDEGGNELSGNHNLQLKAWKETTYGVQAFGEPVTNYNVTVRGNENVSVVKSEDGTFTVTAKTGGKFYLRVQYKGENVEYICRSTFGLKSLWRLLRNLFGSIFGG